MEHKNYENYRDRLNCYNEKRWPPETPVYIKELAEAGFVYTGLNDTVFCFRCGITVSDWREGDDPLKRHEALNKQCAFLVKRLKDVSPSSNQRDESRFYKSLDDFERESLLYDWDPEHGVVRRNLVTQSTASIEDNKNYVINSSEKPKDDNMAEMSQSSLAHKYMRFEVDRFQSFAVCPINKHWPSPELLASAGFFYLNDSKGMACFCCGVVVDDWETSDQDAVKRHQSISAKCAFIHGKPCGNVASDGEQEFIPEMQMLNITSQESAPNISPDQQNHTERSFEPNPMERHSQPTQMTPQYPLHSPVTIAIPAMDLSDKAKRLGTFITYPRNAAVQPVELAEAGFFYVGKGDGVRCYKCDVSLRQFEEGDKAWSEHLRYSPACPLVIKHLRIINGMAYQNQYLETQPVSPSPPDPRYPAQPNGHFPFRPEYAEYTWNGIQNGYPYNPSYNEQNYPSNGHVRPMNGYHNEQHSPVQSLSQYQNKYSQELRHPSIPHMPQPQWQMLRPNFRPYDLANNQLVPSTYALHPSQQMSRNRIPLHHQMSSPLESQANEQSIDTSSHVRHNSAPLLVNQVTKNAMSVQSSLNSPSSSPNSSRHIRQIDNRNEPTLTSVSQGSLDSLLDMGFKREDVLKTVKCYTEYSPKPFKTPDDLAQAVMYFQQHGHLEGTPFGKNLTTDPSEEGKSMIYDRAKRKEVNEEANTKNCKICTICFDADVEVTFVPCGHLVVCQSCALGVKDCPICRLPIEDTVRTYFFGN